MPLSSNRQLNILAIETSCDETAASIVTSRNGSVEIRSNVISSQVDLHAKWGGVVPNLAAREHLKNILPIIEEALSEAQVERESIDLLAVTRGPGLIPALLMGTVTTRTLAYLWKKPLLGIHHIEGHIYANFVGILDEIKFPVLALVVSGGHTQLVLMRDHFHYDIIGETQDDAVGEAFDKAARILGLGYPGGPAIAEAASQLQVAHLAGGQLNYKAHNISLPRPMLNSDNLNFSFSGLKTAVLYTVKKYREEHAISEKESLPEAFIREVAHEFQQAAVDVLVHKTMKAAQTHRPRHILLAGGVSANIELRDQLRQAISDTLPTCTFLTPGKGLSLDNAAMIGAAAAFRWKHMTVQEHDEAQKNWRILKTQANLVLQ